MTTINGENFLKFKMKGPNTNGWILLTKKDALLKLRVNGLYDSFNVFKEDFDSFFADLESNALNNPDSLPILFNNQTIGYEYINAEGESKQKMFGRRDAACFEFRTYTCLEEGELYTSKYRGVDPSRIQADRVLDPIKIQYQLLPGGDVVRKVLENGSELKRSVHLPRAGSINDNGERYTINRIKSRLMQHGWVTSLKKGYEKVKSLMVKS